jgi:cell shape-determining protein MreC
MAEEKRETVGEKYKSLLIGRVETLEYPEPGKAEPYIKTYFQYENLEPMFVLIRKSEWKKEKEDEEVDKMVEEKLKQFSI